MEKLDVIILGATGFSGKYIVKTLARNNSGLKWGIAGRSEDKLQSLMKIVQELDTNANPPIFVCDVSDKNSLIKVCIRTKIIVNCIGPYMDTGHAVVEACIERRTHYIDITVEKFFILDIIRKYHQAATESNVLIIPACGLVSVIPVMGLMHLDDHFSGTLKSVESFTYIELPKETLYPNSKNAVFNAGSLYTTLQRIRNMKDYEKLAKEMLPEIKLPPEMKRFIHFRNGKIWIPQIFPDESIANMSQKYLKDTENKPSIPFKMYLSSTFSFFYLLALPFVLIYYVILQFEWIRKLVAAYPNFFTFGYITHEGPDAEIMSNVKSCTVLEGRGWSEDIKNFSMPVNKSIKLKVTSYDAYQATADAVIASSLTVLEEASKMPSGGVVNCGAAFRRTNIVQRLQKFGIKYEFVDE